MVRKHSGVAVAVDNNCAIEVIDDTYRVITSQPGAGAYKLVNRRGEVSVQRIEQKEEYGPIARLLQRQ